MLLGWLPSFGRGEMVQCRLLDHRPADLSGLKAIILPAVTLGLFQMALIMRLVRSEMIEVLRTDYIKFARARGLPDRAINFGHALKNTLVPVITIAGLQLGSIIAFAIITETVFQWPGMGLLFLRAVQNADIPIMSAYLLLVAVHFRVHQSRRRSALCTWSIRASGSRRVPPGGVSAGSCRTGYPRPQRRWIAALLDSDIVYAFWQSKITVVAALVTLIVVLGAVFRALVAPQDPFDLRR